MVHFFTSCYMVTGSRGEKMNVFYIASQLLSVHHYNKISCNMFCRVIRGNTGCSIVSNNVGSSLARDHPERPVNIEPLVQ